MNNNPKIQALVDNMYKISAEQSKAHSQSVEEFFLETVSEYSYPKIKGEITIGKLKYRGIKIQENISPESWTYSVMQRGIQIGSSLMINKQIPNHHANR